MKDLRANRHVHEEATTRLLRAAGPRTAVSDARSARVKAQLRAGWQDVACASERCAGVSLYPSSALLAAVAGFGSRAESGRLPGGATGRAAGRRGARHWNAAPGGEHTRTRRIRSLSC